jgi:hypothetical protein
MSSTFRYELQSYFNTCSPHNPGCTTGVTCTDCNYNYNGHTEPHYKIAAQLISYLNIPAGIAKTFTETFHVSPNPSNGIFSIRTNGKSTYSAEVYSLLGKIVWSRTIANNSELDLSFLPKGIYIIRLKGATSSYNQRLVIE